MLSNIMFWKLLNTIIVKATIRASKSDGTCPSGFEAFCWYQNLAVLKDKLSKYYAYWILEGAHFLLELKLTTSSTFHTTCVCWSCERVKGNPSKFPYDELFLLIKLSALNQELGIGISFTFIFSI